MHLGLFAQALCFGHMPEAWMAAVIEAAEIITNDRISSPVVPGERPG
jgi:hypothetical protein